MRQRREAAPHGKLRVVKTEQFQWKMRSEPYEETLYECRDCASLIKHTSDVNEFPPYWWFAD